MPISLISVRIVLSTLISIFEESRGQVERATKRARNEGRQPGCRGPRRSKNGAGNGIRTRDFDLGKVALYH